MKFVCAALSVCSLAAAASAGLIYTADLRFVQAVNSFGQNNAHTPPIAFAPFDDSVHTLTNMAEGSCSSDSTHDTALGLASMGGNGSVQAHATTTTPSALVFGGSGNSRFEIKFKPPLNSVFTVSGSFSGTAGRSTFNAEIKVGNTVLAAKTTSGAFNFSVPLTHDTEYKLLVSCAANALLMGSAAPGNLSTSASFTFSAAATDVCSGDLNNDDLVDDADFAIFAPAYNTLDCYDATMPAGCPADLNDDALVDDADFVIFAQGYDALLCPR
ncbi:MAG: hypothetical protein U0570_04470 [Phycisphaerales bacterium]